ncbi:MAG TPA: protein translocase subunit SecD [Dehalococcoidales bacterium]
MRARTWIFWLVLVVLLLALLVDFPLDKGVLGHRGVRLGLDLQGGVHIVYRADLSAVEPGTESAALDGVVAALEDRVNPLGITEPVIQKQGEDRVIVDLPGKAISDTDKERLSRVDILKFGELISENETATWENSEGRWKPATGLINGEVTDLTSRYFKTNTYVGQDNLGQIELHFEWDKEGSELSQQITTRLVVGNQPLGIFEGTEALKGEDGQPIAPRVQAVIIEQGVITGLSYNEASRLSKHLNFGRLPVPLEIIYDQTISPILGADFVELSVKAGLLGIAAVMLFMIIYYRISGLMTSLALIYYGIVLLAIFKLFGVTLTLAGIGGFILSVGKAIDANVLIFERMKEELWVGQTLGAAIEAGFKRAWSAIWDSNITTILAGIILYWLGSSIVASAPLKGFALTLIIGVAVSMFTAVTVTRTFIRPFVNTSFARQKGLFAPYQKKEQKNV